MPYDFQAETYRRFLVERQNMLSAVSTLCRLDLNFIHEQAKGLDAALSEVVATAPYTARVILDEARMVRVVASLCQLLRADLQQLKTEEVTAGHKSADLLP